MIKLFLVFSLLIINGCSFIACGDAGQRNCEGFLCLKPICNGQPLTEKEIAAKVKQ